MRYKDFKKLTLPQGFFDSRKQLGEWGENTALKYLEDLGLNLVERNYHTRYGEIDLILKDGQQVVFVEVKTRISKKFGLPEESFNETKKEKFILASQEYLQKTAQEQATYRIDLIAIDIDLTGQKAKIRHFKNVD